MRASAKKERGGAGRTREGASQSEQDISIICRDMSISGECSTPGRVRIEGRVAGNIIANGVELAPSGSVEGDVLEQGVTPPDQSFVIGGNVSGAVRAGRVEVRRGGSVQGGVVADEAVIHGRVNGGVKAKTRLALEESAEVEGDVLARRLALKEGGRVNGTIRMGENVEPEPGAPPS